MGVYINMEMPKSCWDCPTVSGYEIADEARTRCSTVRCRLTNTKRPAGEAIASDCPLVPVPPHGRLIDADAFIKQKTEQICENCDRRRGMKDGRLTKRFVYAIGDAPCRACDAGDMLDYVDDAPTIIPADKEGA